MLTGKYMGGARPPNARFTLFDGLGVRFRKPIVHEAVDAYAAARQAARPVARAARAGLREEPLVSWARSIIGATSMAQLAEDIAAAQFELDSETLAEIAAIQVRYPNPAG